MKRKKLLSWERGLLNMFKKDVEKIPFLTYDEELLITRQSQRGDEVARNRLIESNLRFVLKVVYKYWRPGLPFMDMVAGGCQGLIKATKTFDPDKGFRFLTYTGNSIAQGVIGAIKDHKRYKHESLDELIYDDESETSEKDLLVSEDPQSDEVAFYNQVRDLLNHLDDRERTIIILRFWHGLTLEEVGLKIHVTKETVRKVESRALRKLRWVIDAKDRETEGRRKRPEISGFPERKL